MDLPQRMHRDRRDFLDTDKHRFTLFGFTGAFLKTAGRPSLKLLVMRASAQLINFVQWLAEPAGVKPKGSR